MLPDLFDKWLPPDYAGSVARIIQSALEASDPRAAVRKALALSGNVLQVGGQTLNLESYGRIRLVGAGKASQAMLRGALDALGDRISGGVIIAKHLEDQSENTGRHMDRFQLLTGGHPVPNAQSIAGAQAMADFLQQGRADDLVICLISGGASALMSLPYPNISLEELQTLTRLLLSCGANIGEMNTLRKHLDRVKGGGLARMAYPAQVVTLILSDVIGSPLDVIASGPTVADATTFAQALSILDKYHLRDRVPESILQTLESGAKGEIEETLKPGDPALRNAIHHLVASNPQAAGAALEQAKAEGFNALLLTTYLQGEASQVGVVLASILHQIHASGQPLRRPACIVAGGETTVTLRGSGQGGRNQEMALGASFLLSGLPRAALLTLGTDGEDGPTDAAGALVTGETLARALERGLDPQAALEANDSYTFFSALDALVVTGPTGTNVNDLVFLFAF